MTQNLFLGYLQHINSVTWACKGELKIFRECMIQFSAQECLCLQPAEQEKQLQPIHAILSGHFAFHVPIRMFSNQNFCSL